MIVTECGVNSNRMTNKFVKSHETFLTKKAFFIIVESRKRL